MKAHNRDRCQQEQDLVSDVLERFSQACSDHNAQTMPTKPAGGAAW